MVTYAWRSSRLVSAAFQGRSGRAETQSDTCKVDLGAKVKRLESRFRMRSSIAVPLSHELWRTDYHPHHHPPLLVGSLTELACTATWSSASVLRYRIQHMLCHFPALECYPSQSLGIGNTRRQRCVRLRKEAHPHLAP